MNSFTRVPDYIAYLAYILTALPQEDDQVRTIAGYLLKNNSRLLLSASLDVAEYAKSAVLQAFVNSPPLIRNAAGHDIVAFLGVIEPRNWPDCLQQLVNMLDSPDPALQEVSRSVMIFRTRNNGIASKQPLAFIPILRGLLPRAKPVRVQLWL